MAHDAQVVARPGRGPAVPVAARDRERLTRHARQAAQRARRLRTAVLASITVDLPPGADPLAIVAAGREPGEPWTVYEQRDRDGRSICGLGAVVALEASGPGRFRELAVRWAALAAEAVADLGGGVEGEGPVALGGFAFTDDGPTTHAWEGFSAASLHVPRLALAARGGRVRATISALVAPDDDPRAAAERALARVDRLGAATPLPMLDPDPVRRARPASALPPAHYEEAVARAVERIRAGRMEKIVLAREVLVRGSTGWRPPEAAAALGVMREAYDGCCVLAVGRGPRTFLAATPELLVRREGHRLATLALAGTTRRSSDPAVESHLAETLLRSTKDREEHAIVVRRILRRLERVALWSTAAPAPQVVQAASAQHLATPIRAQLAEPRSVIELAGLLHPTPAVGGFPEDVALPMIPALEGMDRGWYAGPVGWTDAAGDGELCVALRSALLEPEQVRCFAGVGVVADSDPAAELAETEIKLQALLPLLSG
ncbi:isochorismate synthase [Patulibacter brassicae]|uniref:isochorismate synthase n=1 Tax=Patulibacter brassicae TaxID=1705717 RepID=A0ABU4VEV1_9ACTN|nr:isochorismate synthase [Patulibacter brassicae]MDX8150328.1 isochorismate synthase [Patulibacter brassicae]